MDGWARVLSSEKPGPSSLLSIAHCSLAVTGLTNDCSTMFGFSLCDLLRIGNVNVESAAVFPISAGDNFGNRFIIAGCFG